MPAGRPSSYRPEYADRLREYFNIEAGKDIAYETASGEEKVARAAADFPTFAGFCCEIGIHRDTLHEWIKKHEEFSDAYKEAKEHQERILVQNGLKGGYHANFAIFTAKNVIGWRDKQDIEHTGKDGKDLIPEVSDTELARRIAFELMKVVPKDG